jgi:erythronate-4-phosphate dehydrogenase
VKIVADDKIPFLKGVFEPYAEILYLPGNGITNDIIRNADALIVRTRTKCDEHLLHDTKVRYLATATIGYDHIDTDYCDTNNITWSNAPGCNSSSVRQYIVAALLKAAADFNFLLKGKTLGIIGVGNVGSKIEKVAEIFGMNVLLNDPPRAKKEGGEGFTDIDNLLHNSDIVTVHVPLNIGGEDETFHLFDECTFKKMKKGAWFLNTSRGEVVDSEVLKTMLQTFELGGAVLDVWEDEPYIDEDLMSKVYLATPHIAGYSTDGKANGTSMVVSSLSRFFNLPLDNWYPEDVPRPSSPELFIDCTGKTDEGVIREVVLHTYDIKSDDEKLRRSPTDFEKIRGDYPLRREFSSYSVDLKNASGDVFLTLKKLGFNVII